MPEGDNKIFLPPDYSDASDDDVLDDLDDLELDEDEGALETILDQELKEETKKMNSIPPSYQPTPPSTTPRWGTTGGQQTTYPWQSPQQPASGLWGSPSSSNSPWRQNTTPSFWGQGNNNQKEPINREKRVVFIDFLDGIVETWNSDRVPGFLPRDIYDLKPRFDVWQKLSVFNPERVYILVPKHLLPSTNGSQAWETTLTYFCCALSSFLRVPYTNCQILAQSVIGQSKSSVMSSIIDNKERPINKSDIVVVGIYSGYNGQSDLDLRSAADCGVDYVDLYNLLNNMI